MAPSTDDIAIIGMSCRAPGDATTPEKLWQLCVEGRNTLQEIPSQRFNRAAFHHPKGEHPGSSNVLGAHFLEEDVSLFDASFFGLSTEVAASMDPQFRLQLESTFEALENAGISLGQAAGSNTAVFAGSFFRDYYDSFMRDPGTLPRYFLTGNGAAMLSNRVSHFFDLRGPSVTVDTGCSTGLTALHLACQSLRTGESDMAIIGGANVLLNPDNFIALSCLGFLGPTGKSFSFDSRAEGYGRGEGVATIVAKPLSFALRDGDHVHAVIKGTLLNQDGKTSTITSPSREAQEALIRNCYANASLNPLDTQLLEAHGTGTKTGDPIEAAALRNVFTNGRRADRPLYLSSVKANIGHLESASGIAAVIKVAKALEKGTIPPSANFDMLNPAINLGHSGMIVPTEPVTWPAVPIRRASISNFGYGGTNAHVILEQSLANKSSTNQGDAATNGWHERDSPLIPDGDKISTSQVLVLSAKDNATTLKIAANLEDYLESHKEESSFDDLVFTLNQRRTLFPWRIALAATDLAQLQDTLSLSNLKSAQSNKPPRIGYIFTGQGAQWHAMGRELIIKYPAFRASLQSSDRALQGFGADWSLLEELCRDEEHSRIGEPSLCMPISTAVQLALVDLLHSWGIGPTAVTGHSSGEAAAAYAAGALSRTSALAVPFFRGKLTTDCISKLGLQGSMLAVGVGKDDIQHYLYDVKHGRVVVACINSQSSVTISGDTEAVHEVEQRLIANKIFTRRLKVPAAYHSHHMQPVVDDYRSCLEQNFSQPGQGFGKVLYSSSLSGEMVWSAEQLGPQNWVNNMVMPVEFAKALSNMCFGHARADSDTQEQLVDLLIEIGPHSALAGPTRQILSQPHLKDLCISYVSCLERGKNAVNTVHALVCNLVNAGCLVDLASVNAIQSKSCKVLSDLPPYPWNHSTSYWIEPRINKDHRFRNHPTHDLLGARILGGDDISPTWRHMVSVAELPWLRDHIVQSEIVFPGAAYLVMAIEAVRQINFDSTGPETVYRLSKVTFSNTLVLEEDRPPIELRIRLNPRDDRVLDSQGWWNFQIFSINVGSAWQEHCKGSISFSVQDGHLNEAESVDDMSFDQVDIDSYYQSFSKRGIRYGPLFRNIHHLSKNTNAASGKLRIADVSAVMPGRYQLAHVIHPTTLDALLQLSYATIPEAETTMVPVKIEDIFVHPSISSTPGTELCATVRNTFTENQGFDASITATASCGSSSLVKIDKLHCQAIGTSFGSEQTRDEQSLCSSLVWSLDIEHIQADEFDHILRSPVKADDLAVISDLKRAALYLIHDASHALHNDECDKFDWHHKFMYDWMQMQIKLAQNNELACNSARWLKASQGVKQMLYEKVKTASVTGEMLVKIGKDLPAIFRKEIPPLELMLEGKLLYRYYEKDIRMQHAYGMVDKVMHHYRHKAPRAKILEIGGGTGGCTLPVLQALTDGTGERKIHYFSDFTFTDISSGFFDMAREKLEEWGSLIKYQRLDIEQSPEEQGFVYGTYDLIVACCVLHATKNMQRTMTHVRKLLKPGGKLVMLETTKDCLDMQLIFGTVPGWWLSEEPQRKDSPNLTLDFWQETLVKSGFSGLDASVKAFDDTGLPAAYALSLLLSSALPEIAPSGPEVISLIIGGQKGGLTHAVSHAIRHTLDRDVQIATFADLGDVSGATCVIMDDMETSLLGVTDSTRFESLRQALLASRNAVWISSSNRVETSIVQGLFRVLRLENTAKRFITIGLDDPARQDVDALSMIIAEIIRRGTMSEDEHADSEFVIRGNQVLIPRVYENIKDGHFAIFGEQAMRQGSLAWSDSTKTIRLHVESPGLLSTLGFREVESTPRLSPTGVEIQPHAFGLNFRDIMVAMGQLNSHTMGFECSGIVTKVGSDCHHLAVGDRVAALMNGDWSNRVHVEAETVVRIPDIMDMVTAASIPVVYATAYYSLFDVASLESGETILIHAAAGGVGQAALNLAKLKNAKVFATVGSLEKKQFLVDFYGIPESHIFSSRDASFADGILRLTDGKGVDVVLNSLSGSLLQQSWRCVGELGRFIEIGKKDLEQAKYLDMSPFVRATSFTAVDMLHLARIKPKTVERCLKTVMTLLAEQSIRPISPLRVLPIQDIEQAFRIMSQGKHTGKLLIQVSSTDVITYDRAPKQLRLNPAASYAIVGGAGGLGRSLASLLAERGAKHILLLSRSAGSSQHTREVADLLSARGCQVHGFDCDVTDEGSLQQALKSAEAAGIPPVRGVLQGAMVLDDAVFDNMTYEQWQRALSPKVQGTINLHEQFRNSLDFFVLLSSLIGITGHSSQGNYAAGGTFQDAFARWRSSQGLPAVSIDLGYIKSVGYVAENDAVAERMARMGYRQLEEEQVWRIVESAMLDPIRQIDDCQVITGIAPWDDSDTSAVTWRRDPRFACYKKTVNKDAGGTSKKTTGSKNLREQLTGAPNWSTACDLISDAMVNKLSEMFTIPQADINPDAPVSAYGVDSLVAVELRNWIFATTQADVPIFEVLQNSSLRELASTVAARSNTLKVAGLVPPK